MNKFRQTTLYNVHKNIFDLHDFLPLPQQGANSYLSQYTGYHLYNLHNTALFSQLVMNDDFRHFQLIHTGNAQSTFQLYNLALARSMRDSSVQGTALLKNTVERNISLFRDMHEETFTLLLEICAKDAYESIDLNTFCNKIQDLSPQGYLIASLVLLCLIGHSSTLNEEQATLMTLEIFDKLKEHVQPALQNSLVVHVTPNIITEIFVRISPTLSAGLWSEFFDLFPPLLWIDILCVHPRFQAQHLIRVTPYLNDPEELIEQLYNIRSFDLGLNPVETQQCAMRILQVQMRTA